MNGSLATYHHPIEVLPNTLSLDRGTARLPAILS